MRRPMHLLAVALPLVALLAAFVPAPLAAADDETVYVTRTGSKYHREGCSSLRHSAIPMKLAAAAAAYGPCSRCSPPTLKDAAAPKGDELTRLKEPAGKKSAPMASVRCQATTKRGTQCSRRAKAGGSYCWQHGG